MTVAVIGLLIDNNINFDSNWFLEYLSQYLDSKISFYSSSPELLRVFNKIVNEINNPL